MTYPTTPHPVSGMSRRIEPHDLALPPTQPIDITALIAAELAAASAER